MTQHQRQPIPPVTATSAIYQPSFKTEEMLMRLKTILPVTCVLLALAVPSWAQNTKYDFDYRTTDQRVQVFDDGKVTRIQLPEGTPDPTIVAIEPKGEVLLKVSKEAPHLVVPGIYSRIVMRWGNRREVQAVYNGASAPTPYTERTGAGASFGSVTPEAKFGAIAKPVEVQLAKAVPAMPVADAPRTRAVVEQAPAAVAVAAATVATPVALPVVQVVAQASVETTLPAIAAKTWQVEIKDVTLSNTFARWAESAGQKVRWDAEKHVLVEAPDSLTGSFEDAVVAVLSSPGIAQGSYPLEVCFYPNNPPLARITRKGEQSKECK
jgi:Toxin co-regulated pilus biosynthesis protein Q